MISKTTRAFIRTLPACSFSTSKVADIPTLKEFMKTAEQRPTQPHVEETEALLPDYLQLDRTANKGQSYFIETHGCQMNVADSEIVQTVLEGSGFHQAVDAETADILLLNTCAIREGAEQKIWNKLKSKYDGMKKRNPSKVIGMLGCMAERLKEKVLEQRLVDLVAGPDAYRDIPRLIKIVRHNDTD